MLRACIDCGALSDESRCPDHRATTKRNGSTYAWRKVRAKVLKRDHHRCFYCGEIATTVDHLIPHSRRGTDDLNNLRACCNACNGEKGDRTPSEFDF